MRNSRIVLLICLILAGFSSCRKKNDVPGEESHFVSGQKIRLTVLAGQSTSDPGIEEIITEVVESRLPDVELYWEKMDWGEQFDSHIRIRFAAGEIPDIMIGKAQDISNYAPSGNLAVIPESLSWYIESDLVPSVSYQGKIYGIPYNAFFQGVLYNKEIFRRYNLSVPLTFADLENIAEVLNSKGITPFASHFSESWYTANIFMQIAIGNLFSHDNEWGDKFRSSGVSFSDSEEIISCFENIKFLMENSWDDSLTVNLLSCDERFAEEDAAMYLSGTWSLQNIEALNSDIELGLFPFPTQKGDSRLIIESNLTFMKSANSAHSDAIDQVIKIILDDESLSQQIADYTKTSNVLPNRVSRYPHLIKEDLQKYENEEGFIYADIGNSQLVWNFQEDLAEKTNQWLNGNLSLSELLAGADSKRLVSSSEK